MLKGKLLSVDDAKPSKTQHRKPCSDCPFRRDALPGWLGGKTPQQYGALAMSEERIDCHTKKPHPDKPDFHPQCAGAGIFRSNVCKSPRNAELLVLPADERVLGFDFVAYHQKKNS